MRSSQNPSLSLWEHGSSYRRDLDKALLVKDSYQFSSKIRHLKYSYYSTRL